MIPVQPAKSGYESDAEAVAIELAGLPPMVGPALQEAGIGVVACRNSVIDFDPDLSGKQPRGWPQGKTWDSVPGAYIPRLHAIVIATITGPAGNRIVPPFGSLHGSISLAVHETLHGFDYHLDHKLSEESRFRQAWQADRDILAIPYFTNPDTGPEEAYAESGAQAFATDQSRRHAWPSLQTYWADASALQQIQQRERIAGEKLSSDVREWPRSIGWGRRSEDRGFALFLTAWGDDGEVGHGAVTLREGEPAHAWLESIAVAHGREFKAQGAKWEYGKFDVPPFPIE